MARIKKTKEQFKIFGFDENQKNSKLKIFGLKKYFMNFWPKKPQKEMP